MRGKRVGIGKSGAGYTFTRDIVLGAYGWTLSDLQHTPELDPAEQNQALCNGLVDAIIFEAGHPNGLTQEATTGCRARLVRVAGPMIDRLLATHPDYVTTIIPGGRYAGNPVDVRTIGTKAVLVTSSDQSDERTYALVKAVFENFTDFRGVRHQTQRDRAEIDESSGFKYSFRSAVVGRRRPARRHS